MTSNQSLTWTYTNQTASWLLHNLNTFGAKMNHGQIRTHKIHHGLDLGEATTFPLIVYFVSSHKTNAQMAFCPWTPMTLGAHNFVCKHAIEMRFEAKLQPLLKAFQWYVAHELNTTESG